MYRKGSIRRNLAGEEFYYRGFQWIPFPKDTYDGETRFRNNFPLRVKIHWRTRSVFLLVRWKGSEYLFKKKSFHRIWFRRHVFMFQLSNGVFLLVFGSSIYLLPLDIPIDRFICSTDFNGSDTLAIFTKDFVYLFNKSWKKVSRSNLEKSMKLSGSKDPFFILEELPYTLSFNICPFTKLIFRPTWLEQLKKPLPQYYRTTSISATTIFLEKNFHFKYFEKSSHIPLYALKWIKSHSGEIDRWNKYKEANNARHFFLYEKETIIGYLLCFEGFRQGCTFFSTKYQIVPPGGWKDKWIFPLDVFFKEHFSNMFPFRLV